MIGWDIGGVNTKVARVESGALLQARSHPYEIQRDPLALAPLLRSLANAVGVSADDHHAVTMTAELSQMFRTKREGVAFVLAAMTKAFPSASLHVFTVNGRFLSPADALNEPLAVAASNWAATATIVALDHPNALLIDIGTTTTDIIPIVQGRPAALGTTDPARLASGELVYTGALRTPVEAIVQHAPVGSSLAGVSAESFALIGDVHLWRGDLAPEDYSVTSPDGRPASREFAGERIARVVCADREMLDDQAISAIADAVADAQVDLIGRAIARVRECHRTLQTAVVTGLGSFIATRAARQAALSAIPLAEALGTDGARCAPAAAVALLLERHERGAALSHPDVTPNESITVASIAAGSVETIFKVGGSLLAYPDLLASTLAAIIETSTHARVAIVPGGGPFADAVRDADRRFHLDDDSAHWMAVLAMDQCAHLLAGMRTELTIATSEREVESSIASGRIPVVAPYRWLRDADPLPHTWDVTSDSISAWIASTLGATQLVLVKPPGAAGEGAVDSYFVRAIAPGLRWSIAAAPLSPRELELARG
ncbi:MAG TPA: hydantoinase/oxoprolinase family protein [Gemmatimonadaceae bacterium]|nr:hydantoinase/oxoprolinase family protein [Gemmatimonadaceae bacterium]